MQVIASQGVWHKIIATYDQKPQVEESVNYSKTTKGEISVKALHAWKLPTFPRPMCTLRVWETTITNQTHFRIAIHQGTSFIINYASQVYGSMTIVEEWEDIVDLLSCMCVHIAITMHVCVVYFREFYLENVTKSSNNNS